MKGIILAGGHGTRLEPITLGTSKQLLPIYNKPMIYYPLSMLMLAGIQEVLVITMPETQNAYHNLLQDGSQWGMQFSYVVQLEPRGLAEAFLLDKEFVGNEPVCLVLGDNVFYGYAMSEKLKNAARLTEGALIFAYAVRDPQRYGIVEFDSKGHAISLEEKPAKPKSKYAIPGLYFYDSQVVRIAESIKPSARGELEITDVNQVYLQQGQLKVDELGRGTAWLDAGTHASLLEASMFVQAVEHRQGMMISCPEEIAYRRGFITAEEVRTLALKMNRDNEYRTYLLSLLEEEI
ncbi:glucose-1-phosphate thymidylyltransferase RfbA [Chloroflexi bacterium TSY]|nr:glucose-1-phosphate thymidylyltransferase RfbA [Chloroflexi bacterium TSY]